MDPRCRLLVEGPFDEDSVAVKVVEERRPTTAALDAHIERRWQEALARAQHEQRDLFDSPVLRWLRCHHDGSGGGSGNGSGAGGLEIVVGPGSFREFVGTNLDAELKPDVANDARLGVIPWSHFGNAVGTSAIVLTRDRRVLLGRRSERVFAYSGHVHSFGGILEADPEAEDGAIDAFANLRRELAEELALAPGEMRELTLNGVVVEPRIHQPELLFELRVPLTVEELRARWLGAAARAEHAELVDLADDARALDEERQRVAPLHSFTPIARACLDLHFSRGSLASQESREPRRTRGLPPA